MDNETWKWRSEVSEKRLGSLPFDGPSWDLVYFWLERFLPSYNIFYSLISLVSKWVGLQCSAISWCVCWFNNNKTLLSLVLCDNDDIYYSTVHSVAEIRIADVVYSPHTCTKRVVPEIQLRKVKRKQSIKSTQTRKRHGGIMHKQGGENSIAAEIQ